MKSTTTLRPDGFRFHAPPRSRPTAVVCSSPENPHKPPKRAKLKWDGHSPLQNQMHGTSHPQFCQANYRILGREI